MQRILLSLATVALLLIVAPLQSRAQIISNGGFETPTLPTAGTSESPATGWTYTNGIHCLANVFATEWGIPSGAAGAQVAILQMTSAYSQPITLPVSGTYKLTYLHAARQNDGGAQQYDVMLGSNVLGAFSTVSVATFTPVSLLFYRNAGTEVLRFQGKYTGGDNTAFLDDIAITVSTNATLASIYTAVEVCWETATNKNYQVQWSPSLAGTNWADLGSPFAGTGTNICFLESTRGKEKRFYRVITLE